MRSNNLLAIILTLVNLTSASMIGRDALIISSHNTYIDSSLKPLVTSFMFEASRRNKKINSNYLAVQLGRYGHDDSEIIGTCTRIGDVKVIKIDPKYWAESSESQKEALVFHELAHCLLNRDHCNSTYEDGRYVSIMSEYSGKDIDYTNNRDYYVDELFSKHERCQ